MKQNHVLCLVKMKGLLKDREHQNEALRN